MNEFENINESSLDALNPPLHKADVMRSAVFNEDCIAGMKRYGDKFFDLAVVDPPYGIDIAEWDKQKPTEEYWNELWRVSKNQIVWGGNYFNLPSSRGWIVWDKTERQHKWRKDRDCDDFEMVWTSFDRKAKMLRFTDFGNTSGFDGKLKVDYSFEGKIHPTQKHISLYDWIFQNYSAKGNLILDTHLGSGSSRIAAHKAGLVFVGFETNKEYYEAQEARFKKFSSQMLIQWD